MSILDIKITSDSGNFVSEIVAETIKQLSKVIVVRQRRQMLHMQQGANCLEHGFWIASLVWDFVSIKCRSVFSGECLSTHKGRGYTDIPTF